MESKKATGEGTNEREKKRRRNCNSITQHRHRNVSLSSPAEMGEASGNEGDSLTEHIPYLLSVLACLSRSLPLWMVLQRPRREQRQLHSAQPTLKRNLGENKESRDFLGSQDRGRSDFPMSALMFNRCWLDVDKQEVAGGTVN